MRGLNLLLILTLLPAAALAAQTVRVATFNTFWLYDDAPPHARWADQRSQDYDVSIQRVAAQIAALDADIVGLQEVEGPHVVADLADALAAAGSPYPHRFTGRGLDAYTGQDVAILSRHPAAIEPVLRYPGATEAYRNEHGYPRVATLAKFMRVDLAIGEGADAQILTVFNAHLKSQRAPSYSSERERMAQARLTRRISRGVIERGRPNVLLIGDMNDDRGSRTLNILRGRTDGSWPIHQTTDSQHFEGEAWTHEHQGSREQLDHILANKFMYDCLRAVSIQRVDPAVSDHHPVVAEFEIGCKNSGSES